MAAPDAVFLGTGRATGEALVTVVLALEDVVGREDVERAVRDGLLPAQPRFSARAVPGRWPVRRPAWVPAEVDLAHHLVEGGVVEGLDGLAAALGALAAAPLDLRRPLWRLHLLRLDQPGGSSSVLVARVHHSVADGTALAAALLGLVDEGPDQGAPPVRRRRPPPRPARVLLDLVRTAVVLLLAPRDARPPVGPVAVPAPAWTAPLDLLLLRRIAAALDVSVNDVLLGAVAGALGRDATRGSRRVVVPVDLRAGEPGPPAPGNRVGFALLTLPTGVADPVERVRAVRRATTGLREGGAARSAYLLLTVLGLLPSPVQRWAARFVGARAAAIVTNVRGPAQPLHLGGSRIVRSAFWVPLVGAVGAGVSILSYVGEVVVGVATGPGPADRAARLAAAVEQGVNDLARRTLGVPDDEVVLETVRFDSPLAQSLVAEVQQEYVHRYGGFDESPVDAAEFAPPTGTFLVATYGSVAVGCAGLRRHDATTVEVKRMFVRLEHRRRGHARRLLRALEDHAREHGYRRVVLETGIVQPEAIALYASAGYLPVEGFGHYRDAPLSRAFGKDL